MLLHDMSDSLLAAVRLMNCAGCLILALTVLVKPRKALVVLVTAIPIVNWELAVQIYAEANLHLVTIVMTVRPICGALKMAAWRRLILRLEVHAAALSIVPLFAPKMVSPTGTNVLEILRKLLAMELHVEGLAPIVIRY